MSEIQTWQPRNEVAVSTSQDVAVQRLGEWAQSADAAAAPVLVPARP